MLLNKFYFGRPQLFIVRGILGALEKGLCIGLLTYCFFFRLKFYLDFFYLQNLIIMLKL